MPRLGTGLVVAEAAVMSAGVAAYILFWPRPSATGVAIALAWAGASWLGLWAWSSGGKRRYNSWVMGTSSGLVTAATLLTGRPGVMVISLAPGWFFLLYAGDFVDDLWSGREHGKAGSRTERT